MAVLFTKHYCWFGLLLCSCSWGWRRGAIMLNRLRLIVLCCTQHCSPFAVHALPQHNTGLLCPEVTNMAVHNAHWTPNSFFLLLLLFLYILQLLIVQPKPKIKSENWNSNVLLNSSSQHSLASASSLSRCVIFLLDNIKLKPMCIF